MRVNPNLTPDLLAALNSTRQTTQDALLQLASGRRVNQPSDDPSASAILVQNQDQTIFTNRYVQSLGSIQGQFQTADSALSSVILTLTNAITLGVEAANGPLNDANRAAIVVELQGIQAQLVSLGNTSFEGSPKRSGPMNGLTYSHTISPSGVTSNSRPHCPSQISVLPLASRCAPLMCGLKNV